ncbi:MAG: NAD(P)H-hydrate epimerase [Chloroflexi bacterium]|nr:NAD(P)H-hydrate epimerase [Chloroflexota bacterium]
MIELDRLMVEEYGIGLLQMMENAGRSLAAVARHLLGGDVTGRKVVVLVGAGNNGGGGMAAARHLANAGATVLVALAAPPAGEGGVAEQQRRALVLMGVPGADGAMPVAGLQPALAGADLVLDALIGYSLRGAPREPVAGFIRAANAAQARRLALDLPSGLDPDTGAAGEPCVRASATLTLAWPKNGLLVEAARPFVGDLYLADISVPAAVYRAVGVDPGALFGRGPVMRLQPAGGGWTCVGVLPGVE